VPIDNFEICDFNVDLGNDDNMLNMLGGTAETFESLGYFSGYDVTLDPYCIKVDKPRKIMWNPFFDLSFDFSLAFTLIKRALIFLTLILCMLSYCQTWKPFAEEFNKLLCALTTSEWRARVLICDGVADAPYASIIRRP